jgi:hypothetical protein
MWLGATMTTTTSHIPFSKPMPRPRSDALAEFDRPESKPVDIRQLGRTLGGAVLAAVGGGLCIWLIYLIHAAVFRPEKLGFLLYLVPSEAKDLVLTLPAGTIELPPAGMAVLAYLLLIALAGIGSSVAVALVKEGALLLRHDRPVIAEVTEADPAPASTPHHDGG